MKKIIFVAALMTLTGCSTVQSVQTTVLKYWPRDHDPVAFHQLVLIDLAVERIDCDEPNWVPVVDMSYALARNTEWRRDPQAENIYGLYKHTLKMFSSSNKTFCEFGKKTAQERINAVRSAWKGR